MKRKFYKAVRSALMYDSKHRVLLNKNYSYRIYNAKVDVCGVTELDRIT